MSLFLHPLTIREAVAFVNRHHRHHRMSRYGQALFAIGAATEEDGVCGVVVVGRPKARMADNGWAAEVVRLCTTGLRNVCSMLYQAAWRAARAMGYTKLITYTLPEEGGASLRAAGWKEVGKAGGGSWNRKSRPRVDTHPTQQKLRWEVAA